MLSADIMIMSDDDLFSLLSEWPIQPWLAWGFRGQ